VGPRGQRLPSLCIAIAVAAAGCSRPSPADDGSGAARAFVRQPCTLLNEGEILSTLNLPPGDDEVTFSSNLIRTPIDIAGMAFCGLQHKRRVVAVYIGILATGGATFAKASFAQWTESQPDGGTAVRGIGTSATWSDKAGTLVVLADDKVLGTKVDMGQGEDSRRGRAERLAVKALAKL